MASTLPVRLPRLRVASGNSICNKARRDFSDANLSELGANATTASIEQAKFATMEKRRYKVALLDKEAVSILQATTSFKTEVDPEQDLFKLFDLLETNAKLKARKNPMMLGDRIRARSDQLGLGDFHNLIDLSSDPLANVVESTREKQTDLTV